MIRRAYNYNQYLAERCYDIKIKKCDLYSMLDHPNKLADQVNKKMMEDEIRYKKNCAYLDKVFKEEKE